MAIGIDTSKWKPRKIVGTPANKFRNALGIGLLTIGAISGALFHFMPVTEGIRKASEKLYEDPIEEVERRIMIGTGMRNRSGETIRKIIKEQNRVDRPDT